MNSDYSRFDKLPRRDRLDLFEASAAQLGATSQSIEKDFWACRTIDALFKGMPKQPKLFFKGGTLALQGLRTDPAFFGGH